jgi:hypothetical protein
VTDLSQSPDSLPVRKPGEPLPQSGEPLPQRADPLPQRGELLPQRGEPLPPRSELLPQRGEPLAQDDTRPQRGAPEPLPQRGELLPQRGAPGPLFQRGAPEPLPQRGEPLPQRGAPEPLPQRGELLPQRGEPLPQRGEPLPQRGEPLPQRGEPLPQRGAPLPQRGDENGVQPGALPRRTSRTRPAGRHRSPHRLSVASGAPALVIAVPGTAEADSANVAAEVATIAELSCPGVDIRVGYLDGAAFTLSDCLHSGTGGSEAGQPDSVIVPLLLSPNDRADTALARIAELTEENVTLAAHLAPHPLVAEALHARLAEAGFVRQARAAGLSISSGGRGVVVLADIGEEAAAAASVAAVLLASRLSVPVMPASLGNPASIADAVVRLSESGAASPVLAPCLIGPEISQTVLDDLSAALGAPCAAPLGAHQAVGQLVAIRYGAALARLSLAG